MAAAPTGLVCVTGASGFIGSWVVKGLLAKGYNVRGTVRSLADPKKVDHLTSLPFAAERLALVEADLLNSSSLAAAVIHVASVLPGGELEDPEKQMIEPAVKGTQAVLNACVGESTVQRVVVTSSLAAIFGVDRPDGHLWSEADWSDEARMRRLKRWYPLSKTLAEKAAWEIAEKASFKLVTICPTAVMGPMLQPTMNATSAWLHSMITADKDSIPNSSMSYVDVSCVIDVADAHILALEHPDATGRYLTIHSSVHNKTVYGWLKELAPAYSIPSELKLKEGEKEEAPTQYDLSKLKGLGFEYRDMRSMFADAVASLREHGHLDK